MYRISPPQLHKRCWLYSKTLRWSAQTATITSLKSISNWVWREMVYYFTPSFNKEAISVALTCQPTFYFLKQSPQQRAFCLRWFFFFPLLRTKVRCAFDWEKSLKEQWQFFDIIILVRLSHSLGNSFWKIKHRYQQIWRSVSCLPPKKTAIRRLF